MRRRDVLDPVAHRLVDRVLQRPRPRVHGNHLRPEQPHPGNVRRLARHVDRAHVDAAGDSEARRGRRGRDPVLAGAGLRDHAALSHPRREQHLAQTVVELVGAGVEEILALKSDRGPASALRETRRVGERRRPAAVGSKESIELTPKTRIAAPPVERLFELLERRHQRLGGEPAAVLAEIALPRARARAHLASSARRTASKNRLRRP